jgi:hypothetical protein
VINEHLKDTCAKGELAPKPTLLLIEAKMNKVALDNTP